MRLVIARCCVDYVGRLEAHLPPADRLILIKADGSVSIHADDRAYKPLNWMMPPCSLEVVEANSFDGGDAPTEYSELENEGVEQLWIVTNPKGEQLRIQIFEIF